jgi:hypothetical protein
MRTFAKVVAIGPKYVWLAIPEVWPHKTLTLPVRSLLPKHMRDAVLLEVVVDPASLYSTDVHYRADVEVLSVLERRAHRGPAEERTRKAKGH